MICREGRHFVDTVVIAVPDVDSDGEWPLGVDTTKVEVVGPVQPDVRTVVKRAAWDWAWGRPVRAARPLSLVRNVAITTSHVRVEGDGVSRGAMVRNHNALGNARPRLAAVHANVGGKHAGAVARPAVCVAFVVVTHLFSQCARVVGTRG